MQATKKTIENGDQSQAICHKNIGQWFHGNKEKIKSHNKPGYVEMCNDFSELLIHEFHSDYIKNRYHNR